MQAGAMEMVRVVLTQTQPVIARLRTISDDQIKLMKEDMLMFTRSFCGCAEMASQYLTETLSAAPSTLGVRHHKLSQLTASMALKQITPEMEQELKKLAWELQETTKIADSQPKYYKQTPSLTQYLAELHGVFVKFVQLMFRKFKKLVSTDLKDTPVQEGLGMEEFEAMRLKIEYEHRVYWPHIHNMVKIETLSLSSPGKSKQPQSYRDEPEFLPRLQQFPTPVHEGYLDVVHKYGMFDFEACEVPKHIRDGARELGPVKLPDGSVFQGDWVGALRQGRGKALFANGSYYEGYWSEDKPHYVGRMISADGDLYQVGLVHPG